jgi:hypothetical protein
VTAVNLAGILAINGNVSFLKAISACGRWFTWTFIRTMTWYLASSATASEFTLNGLVWAISLRVTFIAAAKTGMGFQRLWTMNLGMSV